VSIRSRILLVVLAAALLPLGLFGWAARDRAGHDLTRQYSRRVDALVDALDRRLTAEDRDLADRLAGLRADAQSDPRLDLALGGFADRAAYPLEFVEDALNLGRLDLVLLLDQRGREVAGVPSGLVPPDRPLLQAVRRLGDRSGLLRLSDGLARVRADSLVVGGSVHHLLVGRRVTAEDLSAWSDGVITASLVYDGGALAGDDDLRSRLENAGEAGLTNPEAVVPADRYLVRALPFPRLRGGSLAAVPTPPPLVRATLVLTHPLSGRDDLLRRLDLRLAAVAGASVALALLLGVVLSWRVTRSLRLLADRAESLDLERLDPAFPPAGRDEVGRLAGVLEAMRRRLAGGVDRLREAERRAVLGELARQVNHDVRNGFLPVRNVVQHLGRVAREDPADLPRVFLEREQTLTDGLGQLEELAGSWKRLSGRGNPRPLDPVEAVRGALAGFPEQVTVEAAHGVPDLIIDPTALRRMVQNLVRNALESGDDGPARVTVRVEADAAETRIAVQDDGRGLAPQERERIFAPYYTTRAEGTGLGLAIVRRLAADAGGDVRVESEPGAGSTFTLAFARHENGEP